MTAKLVVIAGPDKGKDFALSAGVKVNLGRGDAADFRLTDSAVSRSHAVLEFSNGKALLKDNGSSSGIRINGRTVLEHNLSPNEVFQIGNTKLRFESLPAAVTLPKPAAKQEEPKELAELRKLSGTKLAHFEIGDAVGAGTTGVVFRAQDVKDDREVALKVYTPAFAKKEEDLQRFIRAVKTMMPLSHQALVSLYGGGKTGPHCWMSMEYVEGENLEATIRRIGTSGKLEWKPALRFALDIARALFYLHGENIIHRSLSPAKVLFSRRGSAKLGSLIRAKALSGELAHDVTTGDGFLSDVRFLAPEQVSDLGEVDCRSDIYSLGALVYALLTGKPPFDEPSTMMNVSAIIRTEPQSPREVDPTIPVPMERVVLRMLAKKPEARFATAEELLGELERIPKN